MFRYLPEQASTFAPKIDFLNNLITDISVFFTVAICGAMLYFAFRYRKKDGVDHETPQIHGSNFLEVVWTAVPTIVCIFIAYYGVVYYKEVRDVPKDSIDINVTARQWQWEFNYPNGKKTQNEFVVPVGKPVRMVMQSADVLHSFYLPAMRTKKDVVPGEYSYLPFTAVKVGDYHLFCAEYCGDEHSHMLGMLKVVSEADYLAWLNDKSDEIKNARMTPAEKGLALSKTLGCNACHSIDGNRIVGPSWLKIYGRQGKLADGRSYTADENYIKKSILEPNADIVETYAPNLMPSFQGRVSDDDITNLIAYMKTLTEVAKPAASSKPASQMTPAERGKALYEGAGACKACHSLDGTKVVGPTWKGLYGDKVKLTDGTTVSADDAYIKNSIYEPASQIVDGYQNLMPPYKGKLTDDDVKDIIEFMKTVK